ncbi:acyltransferase family protein [Cryobacterium sp. MLB-32]|uniref:acyltransferase family protein n=1 Tax=Cryobacterium sp. MLB-32 TaxID=1529318 RepID=UPI00068B07B7|nr:acyltransferase family protein [Cryobacterium sp. MLB-32]
MAADSTRQTPPAVKLHFRPDINGLRALAIVPVVLFHAGLPGFSGGFTGVDVFFVISGFLITSNLLREVDRTGRLRLGSFWAARLRRLAPALSVMIVITVLASLVVLSPLEWAALAQQAAASALYVSNVLFAVQSSNYFADGLDQSVLLHTWTLGVEEQFYLLWPVIILGACWLARRGRGGLRRTIVAAFAVTLLASFALSIWQTGAHPTWAFYLLPSRAWEFAAAGLLAALPIGARALRRRTRTLLAVLGLALVLAGVFLLSDAVPFPGVAAVVPVLGTLLLILAGTPRGDGVPESPVLVSRLLGTAPLQWIGSRSYSWYLWHWPVIILAMAALRTQSAAVGSLAALASLGIAVLSYRFVEQRARADARLVASVPLTFTVMGTSAALVLLLAGGAYAGASMVTASEALAPYQAAVTARGQTDCHEQTTADSGIRYCVAGDTTAERTVMLVGDSHAGMWQQALGAAAQAEGYRLVTRWLSACPAIPVAVVNAEGVRDPECEQYRANTVRLIGEQRPDAVVIVDANSYLGRVISDTGEAISPEAQGQRWAAAYSQFVAQIRGFGAVAASVEDNPQLGFNPVLCLTRVFGSAENCAPDLADALATTDVLRRAEATALDTLHVTPRLLTVQRMCDGRSCRVLVGRDPILADQGHLSSAFTTLQIPDLQAFLRTAMAEASP